MLNYDNRVVPSLAHPPQRGWKKYQHRLLTVLQQEEMRHLTIKDLCRHAGVSASAWYKAIKKPPFVEAVEALGVTIKRQQQRHLDVTLAIHPEEELAKDIWDMRRLKPDYPKHRAPYDFKVDFTWIANPILRQQIKAYLRLHLGRWKATTFPNELWNIKLFLKHFPQEMHLGMLDRKLVEEILPRIHQLNNRTACKCLRKTRAMLTYMATSSAWTGPRPPRDLIWKEDIPSAPHPLPRPIPPDVLDQFDPLLEQAVEAMKNGQNPPGVLSPSLWDAFLILRRTGIRVEDLAHLKAPDQYGRHGCLDQDSDGYWWLRIHHHITKMGKDHRLPTKMSDGVVDAVRRQYERIKAIPDHFEGNYLFRREEGVLTYDSIKHALRKLAHRLSHEGKPYCIAGHQFRHTIATDMIEMGVDIYTVKEFLGHSSLAMTERYVQVYLTSLKTKYDAYRAKKQHTSAAELMANQVQITHQESEVDGGWLDGKMGKLYLSPLPDGAGNCAHLPMHDPCPDVPHCPTCPKLRASMRHLPMWENKVKNLRLTVEALRANPLYERARQKHEQELRHAESVVETMRREGFWDGRIHNSKTNSN